MPNHRKLREPEKEFTDFLGIGYAAHVIAISIWIVIFLLIYFLSSARSEASHGDYNINMYTPVEWLNCRACDQLGYHGPYRVHPVRVRPVILPWWMLSPYELYLRK